MGTGYSQLGNGPLRLLGRDSSLRGLLFDGTQELALEALRTKLELPDEAMPEYTRHEQPASQDDHRACYSAWHVGEGRQGHGPNPIRKSSSPP